MDAPDTHIEHMREALALAERGLGPRLAQPDGRRGGRRRERRDDRARLVRRSARRTARRGPRAARGGGPSPGRDGVLLPGALRPSRVDTTMHRRPDRRRCGARRRGRRRSEPARGRPRHRPSASRRRRGHRGRARRGGPSTELRLRAPHPHRAAVRHLEGGRLARRQDGRARRLLPLDLVPGGARRRPSTAGVVGCDRGGGRHRAWPTIRISPCARRSLRTRGSRPGSSWTRAVGSIRPRRSSTTARPRWSPPPSGRRRRAFAPGRPRAPRSIVLEADRSGGVSPIALVAALGKRDVQGVLLEGGATLAWSFLREDAIDRIVQYIAPLVVAGAAAHGVVAGAGFRADRCRARSQLPTGRTRRTRSAGGGRCSPGSLRSGAPCARSRVGACRSTAASW